MNDTFRVVLELKCTPLPPQMGCHMQSAPISGHPYWHANFNDVGCVIHEALIGTPKLMMVGCIVINVACCI